jgi:hypothetical protein
MKSLPLAASAVAITAWLMSTSVVAQQRGTESPQQLHAVNPSLSLSPPTTSPLQEQMRQDYATGLLGAPRTAAAEPVGARSAGTGDRPRA